VVTNFAGEDGTFIIVTFPKEAKDHGCFFDISKGEYVHICKIPNP